MSADEHGPEPIDGAMAARDNFERAMAMARRRYPPDQQWDAFVDEVWAWLNPTVREVDDPADLPRRRIAAGEDLATVVRDMVEGTT